MGLRFALGGVLTCTLEEQGVKRLVVHVGVIRFFTKGGLLVAEFGSLSYPFEAGGFRPLGTCVDYYERLDCLTEPGVVGDDIGV